MYYMNLLMYIYIIIYILYVVLGPNLFIRLCENRKLRIAQSLEVILLRMIYLSFLALLFSAYYFYKPNPENLLNALLVNFTATIAYHVKWNKYYQYNKSVLMHILIIIPIIVSAYIEKINILTYKLNLSLLFIIILLFLYYFFHDYIYDMQKYYEKRDENNKNLDIISNIILKNY